MNACRRYRTHAFTLIELLVVIVIIAVTAGTVVPAYSRYWKRSQFDAAGGQIAGLFAYARQEAVSRDTTVTVAFSPQSETFEASIAPPPPAADLPEALANQSAQAVAEAAAPPRSVPLAEDLKVMGFTSGTSGTAKGNGSATTIRFNSDGTCEGGEFTLASADGATRHFVLLPATGHLITPDDDKAGNANGNGGVTQ